jgi:uncharacterized protein (TIGR02246 family)
VNYSVFRCLTLISLPVFAASPRDEIASFNQKFRDATLQMDNAATMALWAEDGVTLLPGLAPIEGKKTIARWLDGVVAGLAGYRVTTQENDFHDIQISGDWASEWGATHQIVQPPDRKPVIETWGKILLVLHRDADGAWKIREEMWNAGVKPEPGR